MPDRPGPRCGALNPHSGEEDRCQRPAGHAGDHVSPCHAGGLVIYPWKWADEEEARDRPADPDVQKSHWRQHED